jgi:hypothetical protein
MFAHHKLPLQVYLGAIAIYSNAAKGLSALQLSRDLDVQYKSVVPAIVRGAGRFICEDQR